MPIKYVSPAARIVWGHPKKVRAVIDDRTKQPKLDKQGKPRQEITFGIAIPKAESQPLLDAMTAAAAEKFPNGFPQNFAWKYKDGDTAVDLKGKPYREKEGMAGCLILTCRTELVSSVANYEYDHAAQRWVDCPDIKCGDHVQVQITFQAHVPANLNEKPGLYVNPDAVMLYKRDKEIAGGGFDPNAAGFAPPPVQTPPPGAPMPGAPAPAPQQQYAPQPPAPAPQQQYAPQPPAPAPQYAPQPPAPQQQYAPQPPAPAAPAPHTQFLSGPRPDAN